MNRDLVVTRLSARSYAPFEAYGGDRPVRSGTAVRRRGDHDLNPDVSRRARLRPAAVLVPLVDHENGMGVLLTRRTDHLYEHAGQISFPGGRIDPEDADAVACALRETEEEVGLDRDMVDVVGRLDDYEIARSGYIVTPVVGVVAAGCTPDPDPFEVAEVFEIPLRFVLDPANHQRQRWEFNGVERQFYVLEYDGRYIWGATAGMLVNLSEALSE